MSEAPRRTPRPGLISFLVLGPYILVGLGVAVGAANQGMDGRLVEAAGVEFGSWLALALPLGLLTGAIARRVEDWGAPGRREGASAWLRVGVWDATAAHFAPAVPVGALFLLSALDESWRREERLVVGLALVVGALVVTALSLFAAVRLRRALASRPVVLSGGRRLPFVSTAWFAGLVQLAYIAPFGAGFAADTIREGSDAVAAFVMIWTLSAAFVPVFALAALASVVAAGRGLDGITAGLRQAGIGWCMTWLPVWAIAHFAPWQDYVLGAQRLAGAMSALALLAGAVAVLEARRRTLEAA